MQQQDLREQRRSALARLTWEELRAEIEAHQAATWNRSRLLEHAKKHRRDWEVAFGQAASPDDIERLSNMVLREWDRIFTGIEQGGTTYVFIKHIEHGIVIVVASRRGTIRTAFPTDNLLGWIRRHEQYIDISNWAHLALGRD